LADDWHSETGGCPWFTGDEMCFLVLPVTLSRDLVYNTQCISCC